MTESFEICFPFNRFNPGNTVQNYTTYRFDTLLQTSIHNTYADKKCIITKKNIFGCKYITFSALYIVGCVYFLPLILLVIDITVCPIHKTSYIDVPMNFDSIVNVTNIVVEEVVDFVSNINYTAVFEDILITSENIGKTIWENVCSPISFTELQTSLATVFLIIISINLTFIWLSWNKYGGVITDRFIRPSTLKEIEELKLSVAKLKLPCEHTPRL